MDKSAVIAKLREHEPELKAARIVRLSVFGSVARGEASPVPACHGGTFEV
jgi:predicted nucleotidyltransferase